MRKSLLYLTAAIILGIAMTLTPLIAVALVRQDISGNVPRFLGEFGSLERGSYQLNSPESYASDFTVVVVSFVVAVTLYLFVRRRIPRDFTQVRFPPY